MIPALGLTSWFSLMHGSLAPERLIRLVRKAGYSELAVTDVEGLHGLPELAAFAEEYGLKLVAGTVFLESGSRLYAWAESREGFGTLCSLLTARKFDGADIGACISRNGAQGLVFAGTNFALLSDIAERGARKVFVALESGTAMYRVAGNARDAGLPAIAVVRGAWHDVHDRDRLRILEAIDRRCRVSDMEKDWADRQPRLLSSEEALAEFSAFPEAVREAEILAERAIDARDCFSATPVFPAYKGMSREEAALELGRRARSAVPSRYGKSRPDIEARLSRELSIIQSKGFSAYFLVVQDIVSLCPRTCGRGSGASSIVSYLLGITHIDPLLHDLFFERFLNEARNDPPDIDIDFPWDERHKVIKAVFEEYKGHAAMVADHCTFSVRSSVRESALALGYTARQAGDLVARYWYRGTLPDDVLHAMDLVRGAPHYIGAHPGGIVITPRPITWYSHLVPSQLGFPLLAWEKDGTEQAGLVKIDLLGNRSLAVLRDSIELSSAASAGHGQGETLAWNDNSVINDPAAKALIRAGDTLGIFYIESPATRQLLAKMRTGDFEHLVIASSIIRPAANRYIGEFVDRLQGKRWRPLAPAVEAVLKSTCGIMVYQEDVSRVAIAAAGFSAGDADALRKVLSKKRGSLEKYREQFFAGCTENRMPEADAEKLWEMMESFKGYSFCKAHSASYALISFQLAWMKAHHPGVFIASVINNGGGFYSSQTYIEEARRLGFAILPPSVQSSAVRYTVRANSIRAGLAQIRLVDGEVLGAIAADREKGGAFLDYLDFLGRINPGYETCRVLVRSGALDDIAFVNMRGGLLFAEDGEESRALPRPLLLWVYHQWKRSRGNAQSVLSALPAILGSGISDYTASARLKDELEFLGILMSSSKARLLRARALEYCERHAMPPFLESDALRSHLGRLVCLLGIRVTGKEVLTGSGGVMSFYSFSDCKGLYETVVFPDIYSKCREALGLYSAFLVCGKVACDRGAWCLELSDVRVLSRAAEKACTAGCFGTYS